MNNLPFPFKDKNSWPWKDESQDNKYSKGILWPKISIVTPSYNQGHFIEETIRSVLLQRYPNLEYIIIDGGSTDGTVKIIKKYEKWLTYWVSEPDRGQSHAINKGFAKATGEIFAYINSDDYYEPNAFFTIARLFSQNKNLHLVAGECEIFNDNIVKRTFRPWWPEDLVYFLEKTFSSTFAQPSAFWSSTIYKKLGGFDETIHFCFDRNFFLRVGLSGVSPYFLHKKISRFREHKESKTYGDVAGFHQDTISMINKHSDSCGMNEKQKSNVIKSITKEIEFLEVFTVWKQKGRAAAIKKFINMLLKSPGLISQRKILGQGRRLICFKEKTVLELR